MINGSVKKLCKLLILDKAASQFFCFDPKLDKIRRGMITLWLNKNETKNLWSYPNPLLIPISLKV